MNELFNFNKKLQKALDRYSKTTESMFKYQQKVLDTQYNTLLDVIKTINSIDLSAKNNLTVPAKKKVPAKKEEVKTPSTTVKKAEQKKAPAAKTTPKKEPTKKVATKATTKKVNSKPVAKATTKTTTNSTKKATKKTTATKKATNK